MAMKNLVEINIYSIIPKAKKSASAKARLTQQKGFVDRLEGQKPQME
jgi:hypothetical protein